MAQRGKDLLCGRAWQTTACGSKLALRLSIYSLNYDLDVKCPPHTQVPDHLFPSQRLLPEAVQPLGDGI